MRLLLLSSIIGSAFVITGCSSSNSEKNVKSKDLHGIWTLFKETKGSKTIDYSSEKSVSRYEFKENGYFAHFDQITNNKMSRSGIGSIHDNLKGQYELKENKLILNHYIGDSLLTKLFTIESVDSDELILIDKKLGKVSYFKSKFDSNDR
jgi:hypothetical protein